MINSVDPDPSGDDGEDGWGGGGWGAWDDDDGSHGALGALLTAGCRAKTGLLASYAMSLASVAGALLVLVEGYARPRSRLPDGPDGPTPPAPGPPAPPPPAPPGPSPGPTPDPGPPEPPIPTSVWPGAACVVQTVLILSAGLALFLTRAAVRNAADREEREGGLGSSAGFF